MGKADLAMAAKGLFLAVALVAFAGCVAIDVEPLVEPIVALEEIEGAAPAAKTDGQPSKQAVAAAATKQLPVEKGSTAVADNNSAEKFSTPMAAVDQPQMSAAEHAKLKSTLSGRKRTRLTIAKCSGDYATVVAHDEDRKRVKVRLPSGTKKWFKEECRATIGIVAGGGRIDKPLLKAGRAFH